MTSPRRPGPNLEVDNFDVQIPKALSLTDQALVELIKKKSSLFSLTRLTLGAGLVATMGSAMVVGLLHFGAPVADKMASSLEMVSKIDAPSSVFLNLSLLALLGFLGLCLFPTLFKMVKNRLRGFFKKDAYIKLVHEQKWGTPEMHEVERFLQIRENGLTPLTDQDIQELSEDFQSLNASTLQEIFDAAEKSHTLRQADKDHFVAQLKQFRLELARKEYKKAEDHLAAIAAGHAPLPMPEPEAKSDVVFLGEKEMSVLLRQPVEEKPSINQKALD